MVALAETLISQGFSLSIYDTNLSLSGLIGSNQIQISRRIPALGTYLTNDIETCLAESEVVVIAHSNVDFDTMKRSVTSETHIIDVNGWERLQDLPCHYEGFCW